MDIKKILTAISEEECIILYDKEIDGHAIVDKDDYVGDIDGEEYIFLALGPDSKFPVPTSNFSELTIKSKEEYAKEKMMEMFCQE